MLSSSVRDGLYDLPKDPHAIARPAGRRLVRDQPEAGGSALGLQRVLGLGSYQTAWAMLHRFRRAMVRPEREPLHGLVEVDESYLAITDQQTSPVRDGRKSHTTKVLIAIAVEIHEPKGFGRLRLRRIDNDSAACVIPFIKHVVASGARIRTDGSAAYRALVYDDN